MIQISLKNPLLATAKVSRNISTLNRARLDCSRNKRGMMASIFYRCSSLVQMFKFSSDSAAICFYEQNIVRIAD